MLYADLKVVGVYEVEEHSLLAHSTRWKPTAEATRPIADLQRREEQAWWEPVVPLLEHPMHVNTCLELRARGSAKSGQLFGLHDNRTDKLRVGLKGSHAGHSLLLEATKLRQLVGCLPLHGGIEVARRRADLAPELPPLNTQSFRRPGGTQLDLL